MGLEDFSGIEDSEGGMSSAEAAEKYKEAAKKASSGIKKVKKDEKKAKKNDLILADFLIYIIKDKKFDEIFPSFFRVMEKNISSSLILGVLSLICEPISDFIRDYINIEKIKFGFKSDKLIQYNDSALPEEVKNRINLWVEDFTFYILYNPSSVLTQRNIKTLMEDDNVLHFTKEVFIFFFKEINIKINEQKALSYTEFILGEILEVLKNIKMEDI